MNLIKRASPFVVAIALLGCGRGGEPPAAAAAGNGARPAPKDTIVLTPSEQQTGKIETEKAQAGHAPDVMKVSGRIVRADDHTWRVGVRTDGMVRTVLVNVGDRVRKDQVLARYHTDEVREGRAKHRVAIADLQRVQAAATLATRNAERAQTLFNLKAASAQQLDHARQDAVAAATAVTNAETEVTRAAGLLTDELHVPLEPRAGEPDDDQVPITSPGTGVVLERNVTPGRSVGPGDDVFVVSDLSQVWMLASVRQDALDRLRIGQAVSVSLPGISDRRFGGRVASLGQEVDPATRAMPVRLVLANPDGRLHPEMLADADITLAQGASILTVSSEAVQQLNGQDIVFVRTAPDRFVVRPVRVGPTASGRTPVLEGLRDSEDIVVRGSFTLKSHLLRSTMEE